MSFIPFTAINELRVIGETGQPNYENIFNVVEAKNNDEVCPYNRATYSIELCEKLFRIYAPKDAVVYDPFMGSGTTAIACKKMGFDFIGSEISENQCEWAKNRIKNFMVTRKLF